MNSKYLVQHFMAVQCTRQSPVIDFILVAHSIRPNVQHSFGEPAQTFGFDQMS